ncbi:MAG: hypothetical protein ACRD0P_33630, partial [Stackebrandtia sp.]
MQTPCAAFLRVYEPLAAFDEERAALWRDYAASGRAVPVLEGPAIQRKLVYESMNADWDVLPRVSDEAYVLSSEDGPLVCPWEVGPRSAAAVRDVGDLVPDSLVEAFAPPRLSALADGAGTGPDARGDDRAGPFWHEHASMWHVPNRWFVCLEASERELSLDGDERLLRYRVSMARARRRARRAYGILQTSLGQSNPVAVSVRELSEWLSVFHPRSMVEVDYGGLVRVLSDVDLRGDDSPK